MKVLKHVERMKKQGYAPIRRIEKPIFHEVIKGSETTYEPIGRQIVFEGEVMIKTRTLNLNEKNCSFLLTICSINCKINVSKK